MCTHKRQQDPLIVLVGVCGRSASLAALSLEGHRHSHCTPLLRQKAPSPWHWANCLVCALLPAWQHCCKPSMSSRIPSAGICAAGSGCQEQQCPLLTPHPAQALGRRVETASLCVLTHHHFSHHSYLPTGSNHRDTSTTGAQGAECCCNCRALGRDTPGARRELFHPSSCPSGLWVVRDCRAPPNVLIWRQPHCTCAMAGKTDHPQPELSRSIFKLSPCFMGCTRTDAQAPRGHLSMF